MNLFQLIRPYFSEEPIAAALQVGSLVFFSWLAVRGTLATGRKVWAAACWTARTLFCEPEPGPLAASILAALDGECLADDESVLAGGAQIYPLRAAHLDRVCIGKRSVGGLLTVAETTRILLRAETVRQEHAARRRQAEIAGLIAQMQPAKVQPIHPSRVILCGNSSQPLKE